MSKLPKFEQKLSDRIVGPDLDRLWHPGYGIVISYDKYNNTATILMANKGSDEPGQTYMNVPCPTQIGVQAVAPEPGRPCWISFKDAQNAYPVVTNFFNPFHDSIDYARQYTAVNSIPRFMLGV